MILEVFFNLNNSLKTPESAVSPEGIVLHRTSLTPIFTLNWRLLSYMVHLRICFVVVVFFSPLSGGHCRDLTSLPQALLPKEQQKKYLCLPGEEIKLVSHYQHPSRWCWQQCLLLVRLQELMYQCGPPVGNVQKHRSHTPQQWHQNWWPGCIPVISIHTLPTWDMSICCHPLLIYSCACKSSSSRVSGIYAANFQYLLLPVGNVYKLLEETSCKIAKLLMTWNWRE